MFSISIAMGRGTPVVWALLYRTKEKALEASLKLHESQGEISLNDEFGQTIHVVKANVVGILTEDLEQSRVAHLERAIHEQKIRAAVGTRMRSDPAFRDITPAGPAVLGLGR
jgi:hypothetical protein